MALEFESGTEAYKINELLRWVIDPELNVNIVDLGLIYRLDYKTGESIEVDMTLSSPGCPLGDVILTDVHSTLARNYPQLQIRVNLVWEPQWTPDLVSAAGRAALER